MGELALKNKHFRFVEHICQDMAPAEAYAKAFNRQSVGKYESSAASKLLKNPKINDNLLARREGMMITAGITGDAILSKMWKMIENEDVSDSARMQGLIKLGEYRGLWGTHAGDSAGSQININTINFNITNVTDMKLLENLPGERHYIAPPIPAETVPAPVLDSDAERGEDDSQG